MKRIYIKPVAEIVTLKIGDIMERDFITDSIGEESEFDAKENNVIFDDDLFGDTWGIDSNNLWGDEE
ncbi:MAG: hypothetical protein J6T43_01485 [Prevotella sp.]|nr:hypothetical protein [Prevotella sp.]MBP5356363.1 hypothetical protein [Prevotella sp.]